MSHPSASAAFPSTIRRPSAARLAALLAGSVLLAAASSKAWAWQTGAAAEPAIALLASFRAQLALMLAEGVLGLWLISGIKRSIAWLLALVLYGLLALASLHLLVLGQASCGCFGKLPLAPGYSLALDLVLLLVLGVLAPLQEKTETLREAVVWLARGVVGIAATAVAFLFVGWLVFGSPREAIAALRGERILLSLVFSILVRQSQENSEQLH